MDDRQIDRDIERQKVYMHHIIQQTHILYEESLPINQKMTYKHAQILIVTLQKKSTLMTNQYLKFVKYHQSPGIESNRGDAEKRMCSSWFS